MAAQSHTTTDESTDDGTDYEPYPDTLDGIARRVSGTWHKGPACECCLMEWYEDVPTDSPTETRPDPAYRAINVDGRPLTDYFAATLCEEHVRRGAVEARAPDATHLVRVTTEHVGHDPDLSNAAVEATVTGVWEL